MNPPTFEPWRLRRLVQLYEATDCPAHAAEWKQKLAAFEKAATEKSTAPAPERRFDNPRPNAARLVLHPSRSADILVGPCASSPTGGQKCPRSW